MTATPASGLRRLLVDARPVDHPTARGRGIGRYVTGLLEGLGEIDAPFTALVGSDTEAELLADAVAPGRIEQWSPATIRDAARPGTWYLATQLMLHPVSLDPIPRLITAARIPVAAVMYDVIPHRYPDVYLTAPAARNLAAIRTSLARTVDLMLAISTFAADTAAEELAYPRARIATIGAGAERRFVTHRAAPHERPNHLLPGPAHYVVAVTGGDSRKNTEGLLRAWGLLDRGLRRDHHLVVVAAHSAEVARRWRRSAVEAGIADEVTFTGGVSDHDMVALLQHARLAVMPSTEEGFGLPVLEAAACGCPVICSGVSSLPEVLDEPAACFDPHDPAAIAAAIERALVDPRHREVLTLAGSRAARRWTWPAVAGSTLDAIATHGPRWGGAPRPPGRSVAVAGPPDVVNALMVGLADNDGGELDVVGLVDTSATSESVGAHEHRWPIGALGRYRKPWDHDHLVAIVTSLDPCDPVVRFAIASATHVWIMATAVDQGDTATADAIRATTRSVEFVDDRDPAATVLPAILRLVGLVGPDVGRVGPSAARD